MAYLTQRFENFRKNGMHGWAHGRPVAARALLFVPCLLEYLVFSLFCIAALVTVVILMAIAAIFRLDRQPEARMR